MDWSELVHESFRVMRRGDALWRLGIVSALQVALYALLMIAVILPMSVLMQVLSQQGATASASQPDLAGYVPSVLSWVQANEFSLVAGVVTLMFLWCVSGVFDVAATGGSISQASAIAESRSATFAQGMRDGFRVWWRTIGLLAIAAIPSLISLGVFAAVTLLTVTAPISQGQPPSPAAMAAGNGVFSLVSTLLGLLGIPLGVLVQLGMRSVVLEDVTWRSAWDSALKLARSRPGDVAIMYLLQLAAIAIAALVFSLVIGLLVVVFGVLVTLMVTAAHSFSGAATFVSIVGGCLVAGLSLAFSVVVLVWQSVVWTLFWRRVTAGRRSGLPAVAGSGRPTSGPTIAAGSGPMQRVW